MAHRPSHHGAHLVDGRRQGGVDVRRFVGGDRHRLEQLQERRLAAIGVLGVLPLGHVPNEGVKEEPWAVLVGQIVSSTGNSAPPSN